MYHIREAYKEKGSRVITDYAYSQLTLEHKQWYYRETDEDDYTPTSNQIKQSIIDDNDKDNSLINNIVLASDLGISLDNIADTSSSNSDSFSGFGGGDVGGGGSSEDW